MQKKAYRVLEEMCGGEREECRSFVVSNLETLKVVLLETLKNASSPAKRVRILCNKWDRAKVRWKHRLIHGTVWRYLCLWIGSSQPRLKCLTHIVKSLDEEHKTFITALLPEVPTHRADKSKMWKAVVFLIFMRLLPFSGDNMYQGGVCWSP